MYEFLIHIYIPCWASLVAQLVKNPPAMWETWVQSLGWEDPLEKGTATTPVFWPGEFHGWRSLVGYSPWGHKESDKTDRLHKPQIHQEFRLKINSNYNNNIKMPCYLQHESKHYLSLEEE